MNYSVFTGVGCKGNPHTVVFSDNVDINAYKTQSQTLWPRILVVVSRVLVDESSTCESEIRPYFFHAGQQVQFCGSGLLASVQALFDANKLSDDQSFEVTISGLTLSVGKKSGRCFFSGNAALNAQRVRAEPWEAILGTSVLDAVELPSGYLIAEVSSPRVLGSLAPNMKQLERTKGPSLIVTALGAREIREDYALRYFAPQYGNPEDPATGSANFYLMKYWQLKLNKSRLTGRQLSKSGGMFYGNVRGNRVTLSGQVVNEK